MKLSAFLLFFLLSIQLVFAQGFVVKNLNVDVYIQKEGYFDVVEKYDVEFTESKHGLLRNILTHYNFNENGIVNEREIYISNVEVPNYKFEVSPNWISKLNKKLEIKIGDKDKTIYGPHHYEIKYRVENALIFANDSVQFYWNIKPSDWQADFQKVSFKIHAPEGAVLSASNCFVYDGDFGNSIPSQNFEMNYSANQFSAQSKSNIIYYYGQSVTALVKIPKEFVTQVDYSPTWFEKYGWIGILLLPLFGFYLIWVKYGKDDKVVSTTSYYPPNGVDPALAGYLMNDVADTSDLIALIPKWGAEGVILLEDIPKKNWFGAADTRIIKLKELPENVPSYEKTIFKGLFTTFSEKYDLNLLKGNQSNKEQYIDAHDSVLISKLKNTFYKTIQKAKTELKSQAQAFYVQKSNRIMNISFWVLILLEIFVSIFMLYVFGIWAALTSFIVFGFLIIMSFYLRKKNPRGNQAYSELKGFKQFIKLAEVNRIKLLTESDPAYFEKTMSYALAFGLLGKWSKKFSELNIPPPDWYHSSNMGVMSMRNFNHSFSSSISSMQSVMVSSPSSSSSGGGSSGGGFGGGGGGSW